MKNIRIEIKNEKRIKLLVVIMLFNYCYLYLYDFDMYIRKYWLSFLFEIIMDFTLCLIIILLTKRYHILQRCQLDFKDLKQYVLIIPVLAMMFVPRILVFGGFSDGMIMLSPVKIIAESLKYIFVVGVYEEFVYRIYIQKELELLLGRFKVAAPAIAALYFGYIHTVQGSSDQALMAAGIGLVLGFSLYFIDGCTYITIALAHGLFDVISAFVLR